MVLALRFCPVLLVASLMTFLSPTLSPVLALVAACSLGPIPRQVTSLLVTWSTCKDMVLSSVNTVCCLLCTQTAELQVQILIGTSYGYCYILLSGGGGGGAYLTCVDLAGGRLCWPVSM